MKNIFVILGVTFLATSTFFIINNSILANSQEMKINIGQILEKEPQQEKATFVIAGDAMLGRAVAWKFKNNVSGAFSQFPEGFFSNVDAGILNLEGPISDIEFRPDPTADNLIFNFPPQTIDGLKYLGVNAVSLGNNHSQNQGIDGLETTRKLLLESSITPIGSQTKFNENSIRKFGKLSILTINLLETDSNIIDAIKQEKEQKQFVLIFPHWGSEYNTTHSASQEQTAHLWIDAGADIIIGSHPHVVQDGEIYNEKPIFYSLGNFIFDQSFANPTQEGLIIKGEITGETVKLEFFPTKIRNYQVQLKEGAEKEEIINNVKNQLGENYFSNNILKIKKDSN